MLEGPTRRLASLASAADVVLGSGANPEAATRPPITMLRRDGAQLSGWPLFGLVMQSLRLTPAYRVAAQPDSRYDREGTSRNLERRDTDGPPGGDVGDHRRDRDWQHLGRIASIEVAGRDCQPQGR